MMKKLLTLTLGMAMAMGLSAQGTESTISKADILYWVGTGESEAIFVLDINDTALAWGYRFNEADEPSALTMASAIDQADPRFALGMDWSTYTTVYTFVEWPVKVAVNEMDTRFKVDGELADDEDMLSDWDLEDGMVVRVSDQEADVWSTPISPATVATMPVDASIEASAIQYWVGTGNNQAVVAFSWSSPAPKALAWGVRWGDTAPTVTEVLAMLAEADPRLSVSIADNKVDFVGPYSQYHSQEGYLQWNLSSNPYSGPTTPLSNGDFLKIGESAYGTGYDSTEYGGMWYPAGVVWTTPVEAVGTPVEEATFDAANVVYWVGEGSKKVVFAVNWADTALAWGYRFDGESVQLQKVMDDIAAADHRFSYTMNGAYLSDIVLTIGGKTFKGVAGSYWEHLVSGQFSAGLSQAMKDGDFSKWAEPAAGVLVDSANYGGYIAYLYSYPMKIYAIQDAAGIEGVSTTTVSLYPNPATNLLNASFEARTEATEAMLFDMSGRRVAMESVSAGTTSLQMNVSSLPEGVYMLRIGNECAKVVVRR